MIISVFGAATVAQNDPLNQSSYDVGAGLAKAGYTVMTGGYGGVMEQVSKGANEAGGHVIGVTIPNVNLFFERTVNPYVKEERQMDTFHDRLFHLAQQASGYVVMPGGVGTAQELVEVWQLLRLSFIPLRPLVCYGDFWRPVVETLVNSPYVPPTNVPLINFAHTPQEIVSFLQKWSHE
jgi:hypothetical protein